jgi:hypothetical protein
MKIWGICTKVELIKDTNKDPNGDSDAYRFFDSKEKAEAELLSMKNMDKAITGLEMCHSTYNRYTILGIKEFTVE